MNPLAYDIANDIADAFIPGFADDGMVNHWAEIVERRMQQTSTRVLDDRNRVKQLEAIVEALINQRVNATPPPTMLGDRESFEAGVVIAKEKLKTAVISTLLSFRLDVEVLDRVVAAIDSIEVINPKNNG
jgi:hypothetical protein